MHSEHLKKIYEGLPEMEGNACANACGSGACKHECCTVSGCFPKEKVEINKFIKEHNLKVPFIGKQKQGQHGYLLPNTENITGTDIKNPKLQKTRCLYLVNGSCIIYEVRPMICRLFGLGKRMKCSHFPKEAKHDYPPEKLAQLL